MDDVKAWVNQPYTGTIETMGCSFWRLIPKYCPNAKIITIRRPVDDVIDSLVKLGFTASKEFVRSIQMYDRKLDQLEKRLPNVVSIKYSDLENEDTCKNIFEYCLNYPHDSVWWQKMAELNLQIDMAALLRYVKAYQPALSKLALTAKSISTSLMTPHTKIEDGITIQEETVDDLLRDGKSLFAEHSMDVGESPDSYLEKNIPLMRTLEEMGALQTHIARCNGRVFGYLMTIISPSLEHQNTKSGVHTLFYTSKDAKNLGLRLQRASVESLRKKGANEVILRAGIRGSTAGRIATLYRRLGAFEFGQLYKLDLEVGE